MDPVSILATAAGVSKVVWSCSTALNVFIQNVTSSDKTIEALYKETETLRKTLASISRTLESPSLKKHERLPLWEDVNDCLVECHKTLEAFSQKLSGIEQAEGGKGHFFKNAAQVFKMQFRDDEIKTLRAQMHSHSTAMQMVLQMITVHISSTAPDVVLDALTPQLRTLVSLVVDLHKSSLPPEANNQGLYRSRTRLERSAKALASKASAVVSSRSTTWSGSQPDVKGAASRRIKHSVTTGSEFGEPLSSETRSRISQWISEEVRHDESIASNAGESPSLFSEPLLDSTESHTTPEDSNQVDVPLGRDLVDVSDDDEAEFDFEIAQRYLIEGRQRSRSAPAQAEQFLRKAMEKYESSKSIHAIVELPQIKLEIAMLCFQQDRVSEAMDLSSRLLDRSPADDKSRATLLDASYLVSNVYLRRGQFELALQQCKQTLNGRRRFQGKDTAYFQCVALMSEIYRQKGDEIEALALDGLLPSEFSKPQFKPPDRQKFIANECLTSQMEKAALEDTSQPPKSFVHVDSMEQDSNSAGEAEPSVTVDLQPSTSDYKIASDTAMTEEQVLATLDIASKTISKLPRAMAARLASAKALSDSLMTYRSTSFSSTASTLAVDSIPKEEQPRRLSHRPSLDLATAKHASKTLKQHSRLSFTRADIKEHFLWAAESGHESVVRLLLNDWIYHKPHRMLGTHVWTTYEVPLKAVDLDTADERGYAALHLAAARGHSRIVKILLDCGASHNIRADGVDADGNYTSYRQGQLPVECAVANGDESTVAQFECFSKDEPASAGQSGSPKPISPGRLENVDTTSPKRFDVQSDGKDPTTALYINPSVVYPDIIQLMSSKTPEVIAVDTKGSTSLLARLRRR